MAEQIQQKSLKKNALLNVIKTLMGLIFPLITFPYASRVLLPEGMGKVNFAISIISYFSIIATLGIESYGIREAAKVRDDKKKLTQFSAEIFIINMISTVVSYVFFIISLFVIPKFSEYRVLLCVCSSTILFTTLGMNWLYSAVEDYAYITIRSIIFQLISLGLLFLLVHTEEDYIKYAFISVFSNVGSNLLNFIHSRKYIHIISVKKVNLKQHLKPIFVLFSMAIAVKIYTALDVTMLGFIKGDREVGIYTAATKINKIVVMLLASIGAVLLPRLAYLNDKDDNEKFLNLANTNFQIMLLFSLPCTFGLCFLSDSIIFLLSGVEYTAAVLPMRIMNPLIFIMGISNVIGVQLFMPLGKEKWTLLAVLTGAISNFILNYFLIPKYGAVGASVSTIIAESCVSIIELIFARKIINEKRFIPLFVRYFIDSIVMSVPIFFICYFVNIQWLKLILSVICGCIVYFICLIIEKDNLLYGLIRRFNHDGK